MKSNPDTSPVESLRFAYRLSDLPTAQHKAGLAGLVLFVQYLEEQHTEPRPRLINLNIGGVDIEFDKAGLSTLLNAHYAGYPTESRYKSKLPNKTPKRIDPVSREVDGKTKVEKWFVYDDFRPAGKLFEHWLQGGADSPWMKLWQDMLWAVLRAQPTTREEYKRSAEGLPLTLAAKLWPKLLKSGQQGADGNPITDSIAGSIFVGAQDKNAERVSFTGRVEENLLLHFWPLVTPIAVPRTIDIKKRRLVDQGYLLAIPEVADLRNFAIEVRQYWQSLSPKTSGYRPVMSLIDVPEEASLEFLYQLAQRRLDRGYAGLTSELSAIEWYHQEKQGNNVRMHAHGRLAPNARVLRDYERIRGLGGNPLFKALLIRNLVNERHWFSGARSLFANYPVEFFIQSARSPRFRSFGQDVRQLLRQRIFPSLKLKEKPTMAGEPDRNALLAHRVYRLIGDYVKHRTEERSGIDPTKLPKNEEGYPIYPGAYLDIRQKVAKDAFLAMRGRNGRDFVEYFTGTLCSVPQYFGRADEFVEMSLSLIDDPETVKDLSMLALSAWSWQPGKKSESQENPSKD